MNASKERDGQENVGNKHAKDVLTIVGLKDKEDHESKIIVIEGEL